MTLSGLDTSSVAASLRTRWLGRALRCHETLPSTNTEAMEAAAAGAGHGTVVLAEQQTGGRGRQGRTWHSPGGQNLYLSAVLRPEITPADAPPLSLAAAVGLARGVTPFLRAAPTLKWPNDLLVKGRKLCGVLVEMSASARRINHLVLGAGLNVNVTDFPPELRGQATSLRLEAGAPVCREDVLATVLNELEPWLDRLFQQGSGPIIEAWTAHTDWLGQRVTVTRPGGSVSGVAVGLGGGGGLRLRLDDGSEVVAVAGDVREQETET